MNDLATLRLAQKVIYRNQLEPPFNLQNLVQQYANVEFITFPENISADGISLGLKIKKRPDILINNIKPDTRQTFTLAHELGHILIPWHKGNIISHTQAAIDNYRYYKIEQEANLFAGEILFPTDWLIMNLKRFDSKIDWITYVLETCKGSLDALLVKITYLQYPLIVAYVGFNDDIKIYSSKTAPKFYGKVESLDDLSRKFCTYSSFEAGYICGKESLIIDFEGSISNSNTFKDWRTALDFLIEKTNLEHKKGSINSILAVAFNKYKDLSLPDLVNNVYRSFDGRPELESLILQSEFSDYVYLRCEEMKGNNHKSRKRRAPKLKKKK
ncbi:ImmA/IrrE family metallo-endopeptidase [Planctobacterium marinum]|uniref:ImmA/IrrE family metallo-endopeptidase n=1 Tax=Planctobacterium marinum TaxID=1631968 RepID=UPI001E3714D1|nr:ImmA/IrrE family metallo-endopeptidase [Planctobacterium marinum]MCC2608003.1 ImmA/IrrE family metallo-endopeptidase [Planctobacterium marinum]